MSEYVSPSQTEFWHEATALVRDVRRLLANTLDDDTPTGWREQRDAVVEAAEAFRAGVPWDAINAALALIVICTEGIEQRLTKDEYEVVSALLDQALIAGEWYQANAPQEAKSE